MLKLKLNSKFYNQTAINKAIKDYSPLGNISFRKQDGYFVVYFNKIKSDVSEIISDEFGNYVLAQIIKDK
ncbi:MAG: HxsD-like protein [Patescibacteria group bacterium]|nr:HxsD-like protein [Patescibacteria group bacterium]